MKKVLILMATCLLALVSCEKTAIEEHLQPVEGNYEVVTAIIENRSDIDMSGSTARFTREGDSWFFEFQLPLIDGVGFKTLRQELTWNPAFDLFLQVNPSPDYEKVWGFRSANIVVDNQPYIVFRGYGNEHHDMTITWKRIE